MNAASRAYTTLRAYINHEWDRISGTDQEAAWRELEGMTGGRATTSETTVTTTTITFNTPEEKKGHARKLLGVAENAPFDEVRKSFDRLNSRSDPKNFPQGSAEAAQAAEIQKRVNWAFGVLTEGMNTTEKRFRSLEI